MRGGWEGREGRGGSKNLVQSTRCVWGGMGRDREGWGVR